MQTGSQLRHLFVTILKDCIPANPRALWDRFWPHICDDLSYRIQHDTEILEPSEEQIQDLGLYLIDQLLSHVNKRLQDWDTMPLFNMDWRAMLGKHLIQEKHIYNEDEQQRLGEQYISNLNPD